MFDREKYKEFARIQLKNRWPVPILMTLITIIILNILSLPDTLRMFNNNSMEELSQMANMSLQELIESIYNDTSGSSLVAFLLSVTSSLIQFVLAMGTLNVYIKMSRSPQEVHFSDFIDGLNNWKRGILTGLWLSLWIFLWALIAIPVIVAGAFIIVLIATSLSETAIVIILSGFLIIGLIPAAVKALSYSQTFFIAVEYQNVSIRKAMKLSILITNGFKWEIAKTIFTFIGWFILSFLTFGFLDLFVTPYYKMTMTNVFHALVKNALETQIIKPEELTE